MVNEIIFLEFHFALIKFLAVLPQLPPTSTQKKGEILQEVEI